MQTVQTLGADCAAAGPGMNFLGADCADFWVQTVQQRAGKEFWVQTCVQQRAGKEFWVQTVQTLRAAAGPERILGADCADFACSSGPGMNFGCRLCRLWVQTVQTLGAD